MNTNTMPRNPKAFPGKGIEEGMSLRDYFAAKVIQGMAAAGGKFSITAGETFGLQQACTAYVLADAMLEARSK